MLWKRLLAGAGQNHRLRAVAVLLWVLWWESRDKSYNFVNKILLKQSNKFTSFSKTVFHIRLVKTFLIRSQKPEQDQSRLYGPEPVKIGRGSTNTGKQTDFHNII